MVNCIYVFLLYAKILYGIVIVVIIIFFIA